MAFDGAKQTIRVRLLVAPWELDRSELYRNKKPILKLSTGPVQQPNVIAAQLEIGLHSGRYLPTILTEIVDLLLPTLGDIVGFTPAQGKTPDTSDAARWWAWNVIEGLTVSQIAKRESDYGPDAPDLDDRIYQALRRLGLTPRS